MIPLGFRMWVKEKLNDDSALLATHLFNCAQTGGPESIVWGLLKETGDTRYDVQTFRKAAQLVIDFDPELSKVGG